MITDKQLKEWVKDIMYIKDATPPERRLIEDLARCAKELMDLRRQIEDDHQA